MTEGKFKQNIPRSSTTSYISDFSIEEEQVQGEALTSLKEKFNKLVLESQVESKTEEKNEQDIEQFDKNGQQLQPKDSFSLQISSKLSKSNQKTSKSQNLSLSQSRSKDETIPANFTKNSLSQLQQINNMIQKIPLYQFDKQYLAQFKKSIFSQIQEIRLFKKQFQYEFQPNLPILLSDHPLQSICSMYGGQSGLFIVQKQFVHSIWQDVDYFRKSEVCLNDFDSYTCATSLDSEQSSLILATDSNRLLFFSQDNLGIAEKVCQLDLPNTISCLAQKDHELILAAGKTLFSYDVRTDNLNQILEVTDLIQNISLTHNNIMIQQEKKIDVFLSLIHI
eukprot:TRINITY_DN12207_c0_g1_i1.p1 TRINITY_DN12207_c0_g1~~TRINITY_DN12207_c0_g1_i1.p1  ORF type:complete len:336 (-),score=40.12 TRINITY_DN12207_c0_g1_i1:134-1141(-)